MKNKRKLIEKKVLDLFKVLSKDGVSYEKYKKFFKSMDDKKFKKWITSFLANEDSNFFLDAIPYKSEPNLKELREAAKVINCPIEERVTFPHLGGVKTKEKVLVGYLLVKRHQQLVNKKNSIPTSIDQRSFKTGQVVGKSKGSRVSDMDNYALQTIGAHNVLKELLGARADDLEAKTQLYEKINSEGFAYQHEIKSNPERKVALNTVNTYLLGAGIQSDLVTKTLLLPITKDLKEEK